MTKKRQKLNLNRRIFLSGTATLAGLAATATGSCYQVQATPDASATESYFTIVLNADGSSTKTCTNPQTGVVAPGCNSTGTW